MAGPANATQKNPSFLTLTNYDYDEEPIILCDKRDIIQFGASMMPAFFYLVFICSILGNGLILLILLKYEKVKTVTNLFILNLVISDLLFAASLPFWAVYHGSEWIFGDAMCKLMTAIYYIGFYSCILFLTLMSVDRYLAVVHVVSATRTRRVGYAIVASLIVWGVSFLSTLPKFFIYGTRRDSSAGMLCAETGYDEEHIKTWKMVGYGQQFIMFFLIPLIIILYCYILIIVKLFRTRMHDKYKAVKLIFIIVLVFFLCWTPYNVVVLVKILQESANQNCNRGLDYAFYICRGIAYFHCCINPLFYTFVGTKFRRHLAMLFRHRLSCRPSSLRSSSGSKFSEHSPQTLYEY
ncbi:C-C chemokine receptor type 3-like [Ambystoma mexicanum]|uniref:C-C chemokine receptor type 3-like n=1 Tax=Ambystoma mexicanum TaxID=8296 RepID=UPI0037E89255